MPRDFTVKGCELEENEVEQLKVLPGGTRVESGHRSIIQKKMRGNITSMTEGVQFCSNTLTNCNTDMLLNTVQGHRS